ncbi:MAG: ATP-binding cassette domain-containing protein [Polyangiaceae bacterium]
MTLLELVGVSMSFGSTRALRDVSLGFRAGEVHAIVGGNGAGKSTLIKIVCGAHDEYEGELRLDGRRVRFDGPSAARRAGIAVIHQELSLLPNLSIADNLALSEVGSAFAWRSRTRARDRALGVLAKLGLEHDPDTAVERLSLSERQLLEIGRAAAENARLLVMDEPTSALSEPEAERLFEIVRELAQAGTGVIYISHRRDEIERLAQHVSVLRDGALVLSAPSAQVSPEALLRALVGRAASPGQQSLPGASVGRSVALRARDLVARGRESLLGVSFEARAGEVIGLVGLEGSGATAVLASLVGEASLASGSFELFGSAYAPSAALDAWQHRIAYLPADSKAERVCAAQRRLERNAVEPRALLAGRLGVASGRNSRCCARRWRASLAASRTCCAGQRVVGWQPTKAGAAPLFVGRAGAAAAPGADPRRRRDRQSRDRQVAA